MLRSRFVTCGRTWLAWALTVLVGGCGGEEFASNGSGGADAGLGGSGGSAGSAGTAGSGAQSSCAPNTKLCEGACVSVNDAAYGCSLDRCEPCQLPHADAVCDAGACSIGSCDPAFADCHNDQAGCESSLNTTEDCGACGKDCGGAQLCDAGNCVSDCGSKTQCASSCVDLKQDVLNCGKCGNSCPSAPANATPKCVEGACTFECKSGFADCNGASGCETNINSNPSHCGACDKPCAIAPAGATAELCAQAKCECPGARQACATAGATACVLIQQDPKFCGASCTPCSKGQACESGQCEVGACAWGLAECGGGCVSLQSDPAHCGGCGVACSVGQACKAGQCVAATACGTSTCDVSLGPVACPDPALDAAHCGTCSNECSPGEACMGSACVGLEFAREPWECVGAACPVPSWWPIKPAPLHCIPGNLCGAGSSN